jgi:hypothetical protein
VVTTSNIHNKYVLSMSNGRTTFVEMNSSTLYKLQTDDNTELRINYQHDSTFTKEIQFYEELDSTRVLETNSRVFSITKDNTFNYDELQISGLKYFNTSDFVHKTVLFIIQSLSIVIIIGILICLCRTCWNRNRQRTEIQQWFNLQRLNPGTSATN